MSDSQVMAVGVNYEVYDDGKPVRWGNCVTTYDRDSIMTLMDAIRDFAGKENGADPQNIRIVAMWRLA